ncbi:unnamed protein product, partial [Polarella glacialis]
PSSPSPGWRWGGGEQDMSDSPARGLSPLHAKVLNYLGRDSEIDLNLGVGLRAPDSFLDSNGTAASLEAPSLR